MTAKPIRIVIADDHAIVRAGLRELLHQEADLSVVGEAASGEEALTLTARLNPDVLLLDQSMPGLTGLEVLAQLTKRQPAVHCIILTGFADREFFFQALELGAAMACPSTQAWRRCWFITFTDRKPFPPLPYTI